MKSWSMMVRDRQNKILPVITGYIRAYTLELEIIVILTVLTGVLGRLPYLNIFVSRYAPVFVLIISAGLLLKLAISRIMGTIMVLFLYHSALSVMGKGGEAEQVANLIYGLLWFVVILGMTDIRRKQS